MEIAYNNPSINPDFAEQDLVSCAGCGGCSGATMPCPLNWIRDYGAMNESCYPYVARDTSCNPGCSRSYRISEWHQVTPLNNENAIKEALTRGPVIGTFNVYTDFYYYKMVSMNIHGEVWRGATLLSSSVGVRMKEERTGFAKTAGELAGGR